MKHEHTPVPASVQLEADLTQKARMLGNSITAIKQLQGENPADKRVKRYSEALGRTESGLASIKKEAEIARELAKAQKNHRSRHSFSLDRELSW